MKKTIAIKKNHEFRRLYNRGTSAVSPFFAIYCQKNRRGGSRLGITTGVKLGNAVKRNRVRRRIRELYRTNACDMIPGYDIVVVARNRAVYSRYETMRRSYLQLIDQLGLKLPPEGDK